MHLKYIWNLGCVSECGDLFFLCYQGIDLIYMRQFTSHLEKLQINVTVLVKISDTFNVSIDQLILGRNREVGDLDSKHVRVEEQCKEAIIHRTLKLNYFDGEKKIRKVLTL